jgi:hypothetical protein
MELSLSAAARATGRSKSTIGRAIKSGKLSARRDEAGGYRIDAPSWPGRSTGTPRQGSRGALRNLRDLQRDPGRHPRPSCWYCGPAWSCWSRRSSANARPWPMSGRPRPTCASASTGPTSGCARSLPCPLPHHRRHPPQLGAS